jgi:MFS family permease
VLRLFLDQFATVRRAAPRVFWFVWWGTLVNRLGGFVVPLLTIYLTKMRGATVAEAGAVVSFFGAGQVAASIVGGQLTDRVGRRATMLVSLFGGAFAMAALGQARELTEISVCVTAVGFVGELYRPAVAAFISDVVPPGQRLHAFGVLYWAINLGFAFAGTVGGLIADIDFSILFYVDAATSAAFGVIIALNVPETRPARETHTTTRARVSPFADGQFMIFVALNFASALIAMQTQAALSAHMTWQGFSPSTFGMVIAVNGVLIIVLQPLLTSWIARFEPSRVLAVSALLFGGAMAIHGIAPVALAHAGAVMVWTIGEILESPTKSAIVAQMAPVSARGRYQGMLVMSWGLAQVAGPRLGTWIWQHAGPPVLWNGCFALGIAIAAALLATGPARARRLARPMETSGRFPVER